MYKIIESEQVLKSRTSGNIVEWIPFGMRHRTALTAVGNVLSFAWQEFNVTSGEYEASAKTDAFIVQVDDETVNVPVGETLDLSAEVAGVYTVKTMNEAVDNGSIEVTL